MMSPWGKSQEVVKLARGISWVSTAGHGGFMIAAGAAEQVLSQEARNHATERYNDYFCFEEDCDAEIVLYEHPEYAEPLGIKSLANNYESLSRWNPKYLIDRGQQPTQKEYERWQYEDQKSLNCKAYCIDEGLDF